MVALRVVLSLLLLGLPVAAGAQSATVPRVGILSVVPASALEANLAALRRGFRELGYVEGRTLVLDYRSADERPERLPQLAAELVQGGVDVIVATAELPAMAARQVTATIPIVMATSGDPSITGLVASLARPRGNVTGFHAMAPPELGGQRLRLLREVVPAATRVGILWNPSDIYPPALVSDTQKAAAATGVRLTSLEVPRPESFDRIFETALLERIDALIAVEDLLVRTERARVVDFAAMSRLPAMYGLREFVDAGGLIAYGTDRRDLFRRAAGYVDRILKGARPAELPVEGPTKFELAINLKTARGLGLTMPASVLQRADYVVE